MQKQNAGSQADVQDKETLLLKSQTNLQEIQKRLAAAEQSASQALHAAEQRHVAVEERARLSEQVRSAIPSLTSGPGHMPALHICWPCWLATGVTQPPPLPPLFLAPFSTG